MSVFALGIFSSHLENRDERFLLRLDVETVHANHAERIRVRWIRTACSTARSMTSTPIVPDLVRDRDRSVRKSIPSQRGTSRNSRRDPDDTAAVVISVDDPVVEPVASL